MKYYNVIIVCIIIICCHTNAKPFIGIDVDIPVPLPPSAARPKLIEDENTTVSSKEVESLDKSETIFYGYYPYYYGWPYYYYRHPYVYIG